MGEGAEARSLPPGFPVWEEPSWTVKSHPRHPQCAEGEPRSRVVKALAPPVNMLDPGACLRL